MTKFRKGDRVTLLRQYDGKGTVQITDFTVYACGAKRLVLVYDRGERFNGRELSPKLAGDSTFLRVLPRLASDDADAVGLEMAGAWLAYERERLERLIAGYAYPETHAATQAMRRALAELHEPRVIRMEG